MNIFSSVLVLSIAHSVFALDIIYYQPEQIHLSYGDDPSQMVITWSTINATNESIVEYGDELENSAIGFSTLFTDTGDEHRSQYIHRVKLFDLDPQTKYTYHCGSKYGWSALYYFVTTPSGSNWSPRVALFGDMGNENAQSLPRLQQEVEKGMYDAILHVGDFAYNMEDNNARVGDEFMRQIEPIATLVPYMACVGNHEKDHNFTNYKNRFSMPGSENNLLYSFNMGPVHFIAISTEFYYFFQYGFKQVVKQYNWLKNDLQKANLPENRKNQPWIVRVGIPVFHWFGLEKLFYDNGVDLEFWAHEHSYERLWPVYNRKVYNGSWNQPYTNPGAPVHITTGSAGCDERHDPFRDDFPEWSAFHSTDYGYTRMQAFNSSHLYLEQVSDDKDGEIIDKIWVIKDKHGPYCGAADFRTILLVESSFNRDNILLFAMAQGLIKGIQEVVFDELCDNKLKDSIPIISSSSICCSYRTKQQVITESQNLKQKLKILYQNVKLPRVYWLNKGIPLTIKEHFIPLKLENIQTGQPVNSSFLIGKRTLLYSQPVCGKTVQTWRLMHDWAVESDYMKSMQLAFVLPLHLLNYKQFTDLTSAISSYYCFENPKQLKTILKQNPRSLFVLDGLDKLGEEEINILFEFLLKPKYIDSTVVVTCRTNLSQLSEQGISKYFDNQIQISGMEIKDRRQFISKFISQTENKNVVNHIETVIRPISDLFSLPIWVTSLANQIAQSQHITAYTTWTKTDILKFFINYLCRMHLLEDGVSLTENFNVFNRNDSTVAKFRDNCVELGKLCVENILNKKEQFKDSAITKQFCKYGLLNYIKEIDNEHFVFSHTSVSELFAAIYLWNEFHTNDFSFSELNISLINEMVVKIGRTTLVLPLLVGLLKEKAVVLFEQMHPFAHLYSSQELLLWRMLAEHKSNYDFIKVVDFFPVNVHRDVDENLSKFYASSRHAKLVSAGIENGRVKGVFVKSELTFSLPEDTVIPELYIDSNFDSSVDPLFPLIEIISKCMLKLSKLKLLEISESREVLESKMEAILPNLTISLTEIKNQLLNPNKNVESKLLQIVKNTLRNMKKTLSTFSFDNQSKVLISLIEEILPTLEFPSDFSKLNCRSVVWTWAENVHNNENIRDQIWSFYTSIKCIQRGFYFNDIKCVNTALNKQTEMKSLHYEVTKHNAYHSEILCNLLQTSQLEVLSLTLLDKSSLQILHDISPYLTSLKSLNLTNNAKNIVDVDLFMDKISFPLPRKAGWHSLVLFDIKLKHHQIGVRVYHLCVRNSEPETVSAVSSIDVCLLQCTADLLFKLHSLDSNWAGFESVVELGLMLDKHEVAQSFSFWTVVGSFKNLQFLEIAFPAPSMTAVGEIIKCIFMLPITHVLFSYVEWDLDLLSKLISSLDQNLSFSVNIKTISLLTHLDGQESSKVGVIRDHVETLLQLLKQGQFERLQIICSKSRFWPSFMEKQIIDPVLFRVEHCLWGNNREDPETYKILHTDFHAMYNNFSITPLI
uniref:Purple acid phosphatase n=1 Tax=Strigamia maritima TaxID=126957 RepID=T1JCQ8_STRMM